MAVAAWLSYRASDRRPVAVRSAVVAWFGQLVLNIAWSAAFFGRRSPGAGLLVIVPLWAAIAGTVRLVAPLSRLGALLLLPYLAWTTFAAVLNASIWRLNRRGSN